MAVRNIDKCRFEFVVALALSCAACADAHAQTIRWEPYALAIRGGTIPAEIGRLTVPERRSSPARTIEIAFVRLERRSRTPRFPLVYLDGGPGDPGHTFVRVPEYLRLVESVRDTRDVILLSQRGIGLSRPVPSCASAGPLPADVFLSAETMARALEPRTRACAEAWRANGLDLSAYNTEESADDVEDLRRALQVPRIAILGFSYGAHLGLSLIRRHPRSIERAILAGVEGPSHTWKLPSIFDRQFEKLSAAIGHDLVGPWHATLKRAAQTPFVVTHTVEAAPTKLSIGPEALQYFVRRDIGDTNDWPWIPALIMQLHRGETTLLSRIAGGAHRALGAGIRLMPLAIDCASGAASERLARIRAEEQGSTLGAMTNFPFPFVCDTIQIPMLGDGFRAPLTSDVPTLFVSGTLDANAPAAQADQVAAGFSRAISLLVENAGHESTLPLEAVQQRIISFLGGVTLGDERLTTTLPQFLPLKAQP